MAIELLFKRKSSGVLGSLVLDATLRERQNFRNDITAFPIETGSVITDHVVHNPEEYEVEGFVTNSPIGQRDANGFSIGNPLSDVVNEAKNVYDQIIGTAPDRVLNAYLELLNLAGYAYPSQVFQKTGGYGEQLVFTQIYNMQNGGFPQAFQLVKLITNYRVYNNMALLSLDIPTDAKTGDTLKFTAYFRKVNTVDLATVPRTPSKITAKKGSGKGAQQRASNTENKGTAATTSENSSSSILKKLKTGLPHFNG